MVSWIRPTIHFLSIGRIQQQKIATRKPKAPLLRFHSRRLLILLHLPTNLRTMQQFYGHGKLLLTGEYTVLDGALALAIPTRQGQRLRLEDQIGSSALDWTSYDHQGNKWLALRWEPYPTNRLQLSCGDPSLADRLLTILRVAIQLRGGDFSLLTGKKVTSHLDFDRHWGLGSSSTLIHCLASWLEVDAFALLEATFGGSGYDLACAAAKGPILFQRQNGLPVWKEIDWKPSWLDKTYFLYLNQKQNSREGIAHYRQRLVQEEDLDAISLNTAQLVGTRLLHLPYSYECPPPEGHSERTAKNNAPSPSWAVKDGLTSEYPASLEQSQAILAQHEATIARLTQQPAIQTTFPDFPGQLKSLGAWGGDFVWVLTELEEADCRQYFSQRGYDICLPWAAIAL